MDESKKPDSALRGLKSVSLLTLVSRVTGMGRDILMASVFGIGPVLDAFTVAFRIPNLFRRLFGEGAMTAAFLPAFVRLDEAEGREAASRLFSGVLFRLVRILLCLAITAECSVAAVRWLVPLSPESVLLCELSLILVPYMVLICLAGLFSAALHGVRHFLFPAMAPVVLNLVWLAGGTLAAWTLRDSHAKARAIAVCILVGGLLQLVMLWHQARQSGIRVCCSRLLKNEYWQQRTSDVFRALTPVLFGLSVMQINVLVDSFLAWGLMTHEAVSGVGLWDRFCVPEGTAGAMYLGNRLFSFPLGVFAIALGTVLFPRFASHAQAGDYTALSRDIQHGLQLVAVVAVPASAGLWYMAGPVTDLLFRYREFGNDSAALTSSMVAAYGIGVWVYSALVIVNRVFYATGDQVTPLRQGLVCVALNLLFDFVMLPLVGATALPLASIAATLFQLGMAMECLRRDFLCDGRFHIFGVVWRVGVASTAMTAVGMWTLNQLRRLNVLQSVFADRLIAVAVPVAVSVLVYVCMLSLLGIPLRHLLYGAWDGKPSAQSR